MSAATPALIDPASADAAPGTRSMARSVAWTAAAKWSGQALTSGITLLVARILSPSDYGLVGMAVIFLGFVRFLSDFGIGGALVARREFDRDRLAALNTCAILFGLAGTVVTIVAAVPLGSFFGQHQLPQLMLVMSGTFFVSGFRVVPMAVLQRDLRFKLLAGLDLVQAVFAAVTTLLLALAGAGYWALVLGNIAALVLSSTAMVVLSPQRLGRPDLVRLKPAVAMSRDLTIANVCWYAYSNADFLVVGKMLGQTALGLYNIGWTLAMMIVERVTTIIGGVAPAYLSAVKDDVSALRTYLMRISGSIAFLTMPASIGLALVADDFCSVVLGPKWTGAIRSLRLLTLYAGVRSLTPILPQILIVIGEHQFVARNAILAVLVMPAAFLIGAHWGVEGVALAWVLAFPVVTAPLFRYVFKQLDMTLLEYLRGLRLPLLSSAIMGVSVLTLRLAATGAPAALRLGAAVAVGVCSYVTALYVVFGVRPRTIAALVRPSARAA